MANPKKQAQNEQIFIGHVFFALILTAPLLPGKNDSRLFRSILF